MNNHGWVRVHNLSLNRPTSLELIESFCAVLVNSHGWVRVHNLHSESDNADDCCDVFLLQLKEWKHFQEEAAKNDHRRLGRVSSVSCLVS